MKDNKSMTCAEAGRIGGRKAQAKLSSEERSKRAKVAVNKRWEVWRMNRVGVLLDQFKKLGSKEDRRKFIGGLSEDEKKGLRQDHQFLMEDIADLNDRTEELLRSQYE